MDDKGRYYTTLIFVFALIHIHPGLITAPSQCSSNLLLSNGCAPHLVDSRGHDYIAACDKGPICRLILHKAPVQDVATCKQPVVRRSKDGRRVMEALPNNDDSEAHTLG